MHAVKATWTNGQILPAEPVNWPEGSALRVVPVDDKEAWQKAEENWKDDPESIAAWCEWATNLEPLVFTDEERSERDRAFAEYRAFNIEAVRRQMFGEEAP